MNNFSGMEKNTKGAEEKMQKKNKKNDALKKVVAGVAAYLNAVPLAGGVVLDKQNVENMANVPTPQSVVGYAENDNGYNRKPYQMLDNMGKVAQVVGMVMFNTASAAVSVSVLDDSNAVQDIPSGETGIIDTVLDGSQVISSGGKGVVNIMNNGSQYIESDGIGTINTMNSGLQHISSRGTGTISTMNNGRQTIGVSGIGSIDNMYGGTQYNVGYSGIGTVNTMSGGYQYINNNCTGNVQSMYGGTQIIYVSGFGSVSVLNGGTQNLAGAGYLTSRYTSSIMPYTTTIGGTERVITGWTSWYSTYYAGGPTGIIDTAISGIQKIDGGTGIVRIMSGSQSQSVYNSSVTRIICDFNQLVFNRGTGIVENMIGGCQSIYNSGIGIISYMYSGVQSIGNSGIGVVNAMTAVGNQYISSRGTGTINTMFGGYQYISGGGSGNINTMRNGYQHIMGGGKGTINTMSSGYQHISNGGTGIVYTMNGNNGRQFIYGSGF